MSTDIFVGRRVFRRNFSDFVRTMIDEKKESLAFMGFRKQKVQEIHYPRLFLFHGDDGMGKSTMIEQCVSMTKLIAEEVKVSIKTIVLDCRTDLFRNSRIAITPRMVIETFAQILRHPSLGLDRYFSEYARLQPKIATANNHARRLMRQSEWLADRPGFCGNAESSNTAFRQWLSDKKKFTSDELDLYDNSDHRLTNALVNGIIKLSAETPVLIVIDSFETIGCPSVEAWLRESFLKRLVDFDNKIMILLSSRENMGRRYRNDFSEELLHVLDFNDINFTYADIADCARSQDQNWGQDQIAAVEKATRGVPVVVRDMVQLAKNNIPLETLIEEASRHSATSKDLLKGIVQRFFVFSADDATRHQITSLALLLLPDKKVLTTLWNLSANEVDRQLADLSIRFPFATPSGINELMKLNFREYLISIIDTQSSPRIVEETGRFGQQCIEIFSELLAQKKGANKQPEKYCADQGYQQALLGFINAQLWQNRETAFSILPGLFMETIFFAPDITGQILTLFEEFKVILTIKQNKTLQVLSAALEATSTDGVWLCEKVTDTEDAGMDLCEKSIDSVSDTVKAVFFLLNGDRFLRKGDRALARKNYLACKDLSIESDRLRDEVYERLLMISTTDQTQKEDAIMENYQAAASLLQGRYEAWLHIGRIHISRDRHKEAVEALSKASVAKSDMVDIWNDLGKQNQHLDRYGDAITAFHKALDLDANDSSVWFQMGNCYMAIEEFSEAIKSFNRAVRIKPDYAETWYNLAVCHFNLNQLAEGLSACSNAVQKQPGHLNAWLLFGEKSFLAQKPTEAIAAFGKAVELDPKNIDAFASIARIYGQIGDHSSAAQYYRKAINVSDRDATLWNSMGLELESSGNHDEAISAYCKAIEIDKKSFDAWNNLGIVYTELNNNEKASDAYENAVKIKPDADQTWFHLGLIYHGQNRFADASSAYGKAVALLPENVEIWYNKALTHHAQEEFADAAQAYRKVVDLHGDKFDVFESLGICLFATGQFSEAVKVYIRAVLAHDMDAHLWFELGRSAMKADDIPEAERAFKKVTQLAPDNGEAWFQYALANRSEGREQVLLEALQKAAELLPDRPDIAMLLGKSCFANGNLEGARLAFEQATAAGADESEFYNELGQCYQAAGDNARARDLFEKAAALDPDNTDVQYFLAVTCHSLGDYATAEKIYQTVTAVRSDDGAVWHNLALVTHAQGKTKEAVALYRKAAGLLNDAPEINMALATIHQELNQLGDSVAAYRKVVQIAPDNCDAWYGMGNAYYYWKHFSDAITSYSEATTRDPNYFAAFGGMGLAYYAMGNFTQAIDACKKAMAVKPDQGWIQANLALCTLLASRDINSATSEYRTFIEMATSGQEISAALDALQAVLSYDSTLQQAASGIVMELDNAQRQLR